MTSSSSTNDSKSPESGGAHVATVIRYGSDPFVVGRLVLADDAARSKDESIDLLLLAVEAIRDDGVGLRYLTTPAGFHRAPLPSSWSGLAGWRTRAADFDHMVPHVAKIAGALVHDAGAVGGPVRYLSLGIDLKALNGKEHVECSVLYDTRLGQVVGVTGKSYPTVGQQDHLIRNTVPSSHIVSLADDQTATLVCHDLSMFHPRARAVRRGLRSRIGDELEDAITGSQPTIALHQAHTVESPKTWVIAWNSFQSANRSSLRGWTTAFRYQGYNGVQPKSPLTRRVLDGTRGGELSGIDVVLSSASTARQLI